MPFAATLAVAALIPLAGCGSSKHATAGSQTSAQPSAAVRATVDAWAKADTPPAVCALMTYAFKVGVGQPVDGAPGNCTAWVNKALGPFSTGPARIYSVKTLSGQTAVTADLGNNRQTLYLMRECGMLKVNSINKMIPDPPRAPTC